MSNPAITTNRPEDASDPSAEGLARLEQELKLISQALSLLGLRRCSQCGTFFRATDRAACFDGGESVCIRCLECWWNRSRAQLSVKDREIIERRLVTWLINYHGARVVQHRIPERGDLSESLCILAGCTQCDGAGQFGGRSCRACEGRGTVWVVVPKLGGEGHNGPIVGNQ
jgi:hypothetical protein